MSKVKTWLPLFSGFYNTIWDVEEDFDDQEGTWTEEDKQAYYISDLSTEIHQEYRERVSMNITTQIEKILKKMGMVKSIKFEKLVSPKFYNYSNDSIDVIIEPCKGNIKKFLKENSEMFEEYIGRKYTSCDGFMSSYSRDSNEWLEDKDLLEDKHKLGSVLGFILETHDDAIEEASLYDGAEAWLSAPYLSTFKEWQAKNE